MCFQKKCSNYHLASECTDNECNCTCAHCIKQSWRDKSARIKKILNLYFPVVISNIIYKYQKESDPEKYLNGYYRGCAYIKGKNGDEISRIIEIRKEEMKNSENWGIEDVGYHNGLVIEIIRNNQRYYKSNQSFLKTVPYGSWPGFASVTIYDTTYTPSVESSNHWDILIMTFTTALNSVKVEGSLISNISHCNRCNCLYGRGNCDLCINVCRKCGDFKRWKNNTCCEACKDPTILRRENEIKEESKKWHCFECRRVGGANGEGYCVRPDEVNKVFNVWCSSCGSVRRNINF